MATTFAVPDGRVAMAATTYTGNGSTQAVSNAVNGVSFQPDFAWIKYRGGSGYHVLVDSLRTGTGGLAILSSNATDAEYTTSLSNFVTGFNSNGVALGANSGVAYYTNVSGYSMVGWQWKAGGTAVSNTAGTITSSVSANPTAGFSVVTYTGTLSAAGTATVGHGLGVAPAMIITKSRSATSDWIVHHTSLSTPSYAAFLNTTATPSDTSAYGTIAASTASVFTTNYVTGMNISGVTTVAYCWAPVAGYSAFGSYTGNGSADGPFIYTGFRPRYILIKSSGSAQGWVLQDSSRQPYNYTLRNALFANDAMAELNDAYPTDFLSNGFKIRNSGDGVNTSAVTYIYAAFAENPLKYSNAR